MMTEKNLSTSLSEGAEDINRRIADEMEAHIDDASSSIVAKLALACHILADRGHGRTLAGQVSVRAGDGFWTTGFATGFEEARASNLVRVDHDLRVLEGSGMANPATRFHLWVYANRPDVQAIVHTHPPHGSALAMLGLPLEVAHMDMMMFYDDCAVLPKWPGIPFANEEGRIISEALQDKHSILLANHGILTAGESLEHATYLAVNLEHAAEMQLLAASSGHPVSPVDPELALKARSFLVTPKFISATFDYWARVARIAHPEALN